jgi:hypothetical protein
MPPWIFLLMSAGAWWIVFTTRSMVELALALIAALVFLLLGFYGLLSARVGHVTRTQSAREKALLLTIRPKPQAGPSAAPAPNAGASAVGVEHQGSLSGGSRGAARIDAADDSPPRG